MFEAIQGPLLELVEILQGSLLYLDAGAGEIAQTTLGLPFLLGLGVTHVCSLEAASPDDSAYPLLATGQAPTRLAIFTTRLLTDSHRDVLRAVLAHPTASSVAVFCSVSEHAHACQSGTDLGVEAYREYAEALKADVRKARATSAYSSEAPAPGAHFPGPGTAGGGASGGGSPEPRASSFSSAAAAAASLSVRVSFLPLLASCLDPGLFVLPADSSAARRGVCAGRAAGFGPPDPSSSFDPAAGEGSSGGLALTAHALLAVAAALGAPRPELFPLGPVSSALASEIASLPNVSIPSAAATAAAAAAAAATAAGAAAPSPSLALILVDRSLDLAAPATHSDHPWDLLLATAAARQAAEAKAAACGATTAAVSGGGGGQLALWRPVDLRAALPGADPVPMQVPWLPPTAAAGAAGDLPYGQLSYGLYGVEILDPTDRTAVSRVEAVAARPRRDGLAALRRALKEALRTEKITPAVRSKAGAVQSSELRGLAESLAAAPGACSRQRGVAALGLALADAMSGRAAEEWEAAAGLERSVLAALAAGAEGGGGGGGSSSGAAVGVMLDALASAQEGRGLLQVGHVLEVLPAAFSAAPDSDPSSSSSSATSTASAPGGGSGSCPFTSLQQSALKAAVSRAVLDCTAPETALGGRLPAELVSELVARRARLAGAAEEDQHAEDAVHQRVGAALDILFAGLRQASAARERLKTFKKVTHMDVFAENHGSLSPLVRQVVRRVLQRAEVIDWQMQTASSAGGGLVRGLLGGLMGASRALVGRAAGAGGLGGQPAGPQPGEYGTVLVFVVGGISAAEVREARVELDEHVGLGKPRFIFGGTSLLLPQDVALQLAGTGPGVGSGLGQHHRR